MNKPTPTPLCELLKDSDFRADLADYEMHAAKDHPAAKDLAAWILTMWGHKVQ
jgi:hypothetical protein